MRMFNTALLGKWRWEIFQHNVELWTRILLSKYGGWRNLDGHRRSCYHSHWWKDLQLLNQQQQTIALKRQIEWRVGCGDKIKFWEDTWKVDDRPLMVKYASLYQISNQQQQTISLMGSHNDEGWEWNFSWRRNLFDNEATMAAEFIQETAVLTVQQQGADSWVWKADPSGNYSTKAAYDILLEAKRGETDDGPFVELWKLRIPPKAATFAWRLIRDRLPTKANLRRRQVELTDSRCPLCNNMEENAAHLFFNCSKTIPLWWESLSWVKTKATFPQNPKEHFLQHTIGNAGGTKATRWKCWWVALTWTIWHHRNKTVFENQTFITSKVLDDALLLLWSWLRAMEKDFTLHYNQWSSQLRETFG